MLLLLLLREGVVAALWRAGLLADNLTGLLAIPTSQVSKRCTGRANLNMTTYRRLPQFPKVSVPLSSRFAKRFASAEC